MTMTLEVTRPTSEGELLVDTNADKMDEKRLTLEWSASV